MRIAAWTDYPVVELKDTPGKLAPVRQCEIISYDGDKYTQTVVCGVTVEIKAGYLYTEQGRCGEVPNVPRMQLERLPRW